jgi:hypothetical protein
MLGSAFHFLGVLFVNSLWFKISVGVSIFNHLLGGLIMQQITVKQAPKGEYIKLRDSESSPVWVRDYYDQSLKKYCLYAFDDVNKCLYVKGSKPVFVGFTF